MKKWKVNIPDKAITDKLAKDTGLPKFVCKLLVSKGITSHEAADVFFNSSEFSDPFEIKDMDKAVAVINEAVENGSPIMIYGDYDCDGITSTYMLYSYLEAMGAEVSWYIPSREEGYGLHNEAVDIFAKQGIELIITVDNGISAANEAEHIYELGMKLVITDHHAVPEKLPRAEAVVDPHRSDDISTCKNLAGCGVVLKLIMAMEGDTEGVLTQFGDIAAIGTIADIMRLDGENRIIVREGLRLMSNTENMGLSRLIAKSGIESGGEISSEKVAFFIAPRINAAGRCKDPSIGMKLLMCESMNAAEAAATELCELNDVRKEEERKIVAAIEEQIRKEPDLLCRKILIVKGDGWRHGVIGLASSRLLHKYGKPNIIITNEGETSRGSGRSTEGLSLPAMLTACADKLIYFGGHPAAAGLTLETSRVDEFIDAAHEYCRRNVTGICCETVTADMEITPEELTLSNVSLIKNLEPFGEGNRLPLFLMRECDITSKRSVSNGNYVSLELDFGGTAQRAINFNSTYDAFPYSEGDTVDILATLEEDEYNGVRRIKIKVEDIRYSRIDQDRYFAAKAAYEDMRCGAVDKRLLCRMIPERAELMKVYDILKGMKSFSAAEMIAVHSGINACKFRVILDVFAEFGLCEADIPADTVKLLPAKGKAELESSKVIASLRAQT